MEVALSNRPFSSNEFVCQQKNNSVRSNSSIGDCFPARKPKSSCLLSGHSKDFKNVETFNLHPGYRLSRSVGKIYVAVQTKDPFIKPKPQPKKFNVAEMEALISDLREQVSLLSTFLEEERLRHSGTRKRAALDLSQKEKDLSATFSEEINKINQAHEEEKRDLKSTHEFHVKVISTEHDEIVEKMRTEYRMLQASFKIYRSTLQEEMQDELKLKRTEFEWEMKRAIENAIDDNKREMEEKFSLEREELRKEFRVNLTDMMKQHKTEIEEVKEKYVKKSESIDVMRQRSMQLDVVEEQLKQAKELLEEEKASSRRAKSQLTDVNMKLNTLQAQFGDKVSFVEEQHRAVIDALKLDRADVKRRLVRSCEELQIERIARETSEKQRKEAAIRSLKARFCDCERRLDKSAQPTSAAPPGDDSETRNYLSSHDRDHGVMHRYGSPMKNFPLSTSDSEKMLLFDGVPISKDALATKGMQLDDVITPQHAIPHHATPQHATPHRATPQHATPHRVTPQHATHHHTSPLNTTTNHRGYNGDATEKNGGEYFQDGIRHSKGESSWKSPINLQRTNDASSQEIARSLEDTDQHDEESKMRLSKDGRLSFSQPQPGKRDGVLDQASYQRNTLSQGGTASSLAESAQGSTAQPAEGVLPSESQVEITVQIDSPDSGFSQTGSKSTPEGQPGLSRGEFLRKKSALGTELRLKKSSHKKSSGMQPKFLIDDDDENDGTPFTISPYGTKRRSTRKPSARDLMPPSQKRSPSLYGGHLFSGNNQSRRVTVMVPEGHICIASSVQLHSPRPSFKHVEKVVFVPTKQDENSDSDRTNSPDVIY